MTILRGWLEIFFFWYGMVISVEICMFILRKNSFDKLIFWKTD